MKLVIFLFCVHIWKCLSTASYPVHHSNIRGKVRPLDSGWDDNAVNLYSSTMDKIVDETYQSLEKILNYTIHPLGPVRFFASSGLPKIDKIPSWELGTYKHFLKFLVHSTYLIDFGTWVGTTILFGAQMVDFALGIEADPAAYAYVSYNLNLNKNQDWSRHTNIMAGAVGLGNETEAAAYQVTVKSSSPGNSCSGFGKSVHGCGKTAWTSWNVSSYPLPTIMAHYRIPASTDTFIKIDIESFECQLLPSLESWFRGLLDNKPTLFVAFHGYSNKKEYACTDEEFAVISRVLRSYRYTSSPQCFQEEQWTCIWREHLFSDSLKWPRNIQ